jgi:hypothetical protein
MTIEDEAVKVRQKQLHEHVSTDGQIVYRMGWDDDGSLGRFGFYHLIMFLRGEEFGHVSGPNKQACLVGAQALLTHELLRRADMRETGGHECPFCPKTCIGCEKQDAANGSEFCYDCLDSAYREAR